MEESGIVGKAEEEKEFLLERVKKIVALTLSKSPPANAADGAPRTFGPGIGKLFESGFVFFLR